MSGHAPTRGMQTFIYVWTGQLVSSIGTGLTNFALGLWVYQRTGSATQFALISLFATLPGAVTLPLVGVLIDRWNRRAVMILGNTGAGLTTLLAALLILIGELQVWHIYLGVTLRAVFSSVLQLSFATTTTLLVPKQHLGRASGMFQSIQASTQIVSPMLASLLLASVQLLGIIVIDFMTYLVAVFTLLWVRFPKPAPIVESGAADAGRKRRGVTYGWTYIKERRGLLALLIYFAAVNFITGCTMVLFTPMVLGFASVRELGIILSVSGVGYLCGSLMMSVWGGPKNRLKGVFVSGFVFGLCGVLVGLRPHVPLIAAGAFSMFFVLPIINACSQAIWQSKIPTEVQGRVFATRRMIGASTIPLAYLVAGPLADRVFEPLMSGGLIGERIGAIIGRGMGRGIGLMFIIAGVLTMSAQLGGYLYTPLRRIEDDLPDNMPDASFSKSSSY